MSFFTELKRRNVIRVAGLYLVGAWFFVQVAETLLPIFDTPTWVLKTLVVALSLGFLPALVISWVFEMTPDGIKRERDVDRSQSATDKTARRLDIVVILLLLGIGGLFLWREYAPDRSSPTTNSTASKNTDEVITDKSIAVLPFADFSPGGDQAWFADGLSEEILNSLARTPDLLVSARTSSFRYKGSELSVPQIAADLGVANILEGSVRSTPERIRVTAQLIRAVDGFHLWSQTYDRDVADMIAIQEDLARQIATAMQTSMDPEALADMARVGTRSVEAYQAYVRGVAISAVGGWKEAEEAYALFEQARIEDPGFADAHARSAEYWLEKLAPNKASSLGDFSDISVLEQQYKTRIELAMQNAANETDRLGYEALKAYRDLRLRDSIDLFARYLEQRPGSGAAIWRTLEAGTLASDQVTMESMLARLVPLSRTNLEAAGTLANYSYRTQDKHRAAEQVLVLLARWPDDSNVLYQAHRTLLWDGRVDAAAQTLARYKANAGSDSPYFDIPSARQACAEGRRTEVEQLLAAVPETDIASQWHLLMLLGRPSEAAEVLRVLERTGNLFGLAGFLNYPQFDPTPYPALMGILAREKIERPPPVPIPFACPPPDSANATKPQAGTP